MIGDDPEELEADESVAHDPAGIAEPEVAADAVAAASDITASRDVGTTLSADGVTARLRVKIERLGPVNMMAIDQFDELETRYTFLTTQRKDLVDSIVAIGDAIKRIDQTTARAVSRRVHGHQRAFSTDVFDPLRAVVAPGWCCWTKTDPLESGLDIIAQPPGKRLQSVQLLSGGEKALSAMALMFAVFKYKPSPFCLLDEIDAPLDDANTSRFLDMLCGMQTHTQVILVTHNRKTMEIAAGSMV